MAHILLAEDNEALAKVLCFSLESAGFTVTVAHNGRIAWECAQQVDFDMVISDYGMPEMTGADLCRYLRQHESYDQTPVIFMTAFARDLNVQNLSEELRFSAFLPKPFALTELVEKANELLAECPA